MPLVLSIGLLPGTLSNSSGAILHWHSIVLGPTFGECWHYLVTKETLQAEEAIKQNLTSTHPYIAKQHSYSLLPSSTHTGYLCFCFCQIGYFEIINRVNIVKRLECYAIWNGCAVWPVFRGHSLQCMIEVAR